MDLRRLRWTCYLMVGARALYVVSALNLQKCNIENRLGLNYIYFCTFWANLHLRFQAVRGRVCKALNVQ